MSCTVDLTMPNAFTPGLVRLSPEEEAMIDRRGRLLGPAYRLMYASPLHIVRGEGVWLYDADGRRYLDAYNNVASLGHCHPRVVDAIRKQVGILATNTRYLHETILDYSEALLSTFPGELGHVMFASSGSEANDLAYRIAKHYTGGTGVIVTEFAYHGISDAVSQFSPTLGKAVNLGTHVRTVPTPVLGRVSDPDVQRSFALSVEAAIEDLQRHGVKPAMLIVDSLFTSEGLVTEPRAFLKDAVDAIRRAGGIFIADEVQPGFGRTGDTLWGFSRHAVIPDIVTLGKPMGNGQPISGVVVRPEIVDSFGKTARYFNTFAGNAVSCAAAMAVLEAIKEEKLQENARAVGSYLLGKLNSLRAKSDSLGEVRGAGLFFGVDILESRSRKAAARDEASRIVNQMRENGVLISVSGKGYDVLKIRPPLVITRENADQFVSALQSALEPT